MWVNYKCNQTYLKKKKKTHLVVCWWWSTYFFKDQLWMVSVHSFRKVVLNLRGWATFSNMWLRSLECIKIFNLQLQTVAKSELWRSLGVTTTQGTILKCLGIRNIDDQLCSRSWCMQITAIVFVLSTSSFLWK